MTEQELAAVVVADMESKGFEVYQEVQPMYGSHVADIVATKGDDSYIVEVKTSFTAALVEQAWGWRGCANFVLVAMPQAHRRVPGRNILHRFCSDNGIGTVEVHHFYGDKFDLSWRIPDRAEENVTLDIRKSLCEQQKTFCKAGSAKGGHYTKFKATCIAWLAYVEANPGCTLKEICAEAPHHYSSDASARGCMARLIEDEVVKGIWINRTKKPFRLFPRA